MTKYNFLLVFFGRCLVIQQEMIVIALMGQHCSLKLPQRFHIFH